MTNNGSVYQPIDCGLYDYLERWATLKQDLIIYYTTSQIDKQEISAKITTLKTSNKEEFLILDNGIHIRLDHITSIKEVL